MDEKTWDVTVVLKDGQVIRWVGPARGPTQALAIAIFGQASPEQVASFEGRLAE